MCALDFVIEVSFVVGLKVVVLLILLSFTMPTANTIMMQGSESGIIILDASGQYCSSMAIDAGSILLGSFSTNGSLVEFFVIHEAFL